MSRYTSVPTDPPPRIEPQQDSIVPDWVIDGLFGRGLGYGDWKKELSGLKYRWSESLKYRIIKREYEFFKEEIQRLKSEPNTGKGSGPKTNSLESILKRLKGEVWIKGVLDEKDQRTRDGRLLGKDAKIRCLQYHVSKWTQGRNRTSFDTSGVPVSSDDRSSTASASASQGSSSSSCVAEQNFISDQERPIAPIQPTASSLVDNERHSKGNFSFPHGGSRTIQPEAMSPAYADTPHLTFASYAPTFPENDNAIPLNLSHNASHGAIPPYSNDASKSDMDSLLSGFYDMPNWSPDLTPENDFSIPQDDMGTFPVCVISSSAPEEPSLRADWFPVVFGDCRNWDEKSASRNENFFQVNGDLSSIGTHGVVNPREYMNPTQSSKLSRGTQTRTSANFFPLRSPNRVASSHLNGFSLFPQGQERNHLGGESPPHYSSRGADAEMTDFDHSYCLDDTGTLRSTRPGEDLRRHPSQRRKEINQLRSRSSKRLKEALKLAKTEVQKEREARQAAESTVHELLEWIDSLQTSLKMSNLRFEEPIPENLHSANGRSTSEAPQLFAPPPPPPSPLPRRRFSLEKCLQPSTPTRFSCNSTRCTSTCPVFPGHQRSEASGSLRQLVRKISDKCLRKTYTERTDSVTHLPSQKELEEDPKEVAQVEKRHRIGKEVRHSWG